jgi:hypothetical protein
MANLGGGRTLASPKPATIRAPPTRSDSPDHRQSVAGPEHTRRTNSPARRRPQPPSTNSPARRRPQPPARAASLTVDRFATRLVEENRRPMGPAASGPAHRHTRAEGGRGPLGRRQPLAEQREKGRHPSVEQTKRWIPARQKGAAQPLPKGREIPTAKTGVLRIEVGARFPQTRSREWTVGPRCGGWLGLSDHLRDGPLGWALPGTPSRNHHHHRWGTGR